MCEKRENKLISSAGYNWIIERGLVGFEPFTALQPWYFLNEKDVFDINARWPLGSLRGQVIAFARRQDCDDIACFERTSDQESVVIVQGWSGGAYDFISRYSDFWSWLKSAIDDIADWSALPGKE